MSDDQYTVTKDLTHKIAALSKITVSENEVEGFSNSLSNILEMFSKLTEVDTEKVDHLSIMLNLNINSLAKNNLPENEDHSSEIQSFSKSYDRDTHQFNVPKVIDQD